jgi:hypothetical protein
MAFEVEEDDAHPRGRSNATVTDEQGDCHHKGKSVIGSSSSGFAGMSTTHVNTIEVVTQNGRYMLVYFYVMVNKKYHFLLYGTRALLKYCCLTLHGGV